MTRFYYTPWQPDLKATAEQIEARIAHCKYLGLPPSAPATEYNAARAALGEAERAAMLDAGRKAAEQWGNMIAWREPGLNDGEALLPAMESGLYEYLMLGGGRAGGKSHEVAEALVDLCSRVPKRVVCGREFMATIRDSARSLLVNKIKAHPSAADWEITDNELRHSNGTLFTFMGMARNPDSAKSLEGCDIFWGEESQTFTHKSIEILLPTIRESGSMLIFSFNARYPDDPVPRMAMVPAERPDALWYKVVQFEENPYIFISRLMNDLRKSFRVSKRFRHVWRGDLDRNSELKIIDHKVGRPPVAGMRSGTLLYGIDFGGTDPTALVKLEVWPPQLCGRDEDDKGIMYIQKEFYSPCRSNREIVKGVIDTCPELVEGHYELKADSADPKAIGELNNASIPTRGAEKGPGSVEAGLRTIADFEVWIDPGCPNVTKCAEQYRWKADRNGKATNVPEHAFSHPWDAVRYAIEGEDLSGSDGVSYIILGEAS